MILKDGKAALLWVALMVFCPTVMIEVATGATQSPDGSEGWHIPEGAAMEHNPQPLNDADVISTRIGRQVDAILDAGPCPGSPTTVIDLAVSPPAIVRLGLGDPARLGLVTGEAGTV